MVFSRQEYWSGCHFLLQGIFPTQGLNPGLHCRQILYWLSDEGNSHRRNVEMIYNVVLVSGVQQSYSLYIYILFQILFHYRLLQDIGYSSLCCTVGPCCLSIFYSFVSVNLKLLIYPPSPWESLFLTGEIIYWAMMNFHKHLLCWGLVLIQFLKYYTWFLFYKWLFQINRPSQPLLLMKYIDCMWQVLCYPVHFCFHLILTLTLGSL